MAARKKTASRGFVNNIILESLISGDKYGYEIIKEVEDKSNGKIQLKQPSLYSSLKRFETKGFITSYWGDSDIGGRRHYYTITELGKAHYNKTINKGYDLDNDIDDDIVDNEIKEQVVMGSETIEDNNHSTAPTTNTDDEDYNIFELLEKQPTQSAAPSKPKEVKTIPTQKPGTIKENSIQVEMFTTPSPQTEIYQEEQINLEHIQQLKLNEQQNEAEEINTKSEIPLIKEQSQDFFSWEDLKRKQVAQSKEVIKEEQPEPIKNQVVMDEFGILKVGQPITSKKEQRIFDNVGARIDYKDPVIKQSPKAEKVESYQTELTEEEREIRNKKFNEKFNEIISQKTGIVEEQPEPNIDYKNILGDLLAPEEETSIPEENNDYINFDYEEEIPAQQIEEAIVQTQNYNYNIQPKKNFEPEGFKFKPFLTEVDEDKKDTNFVLVNKARFKYGIFMFILMILQTSTLLIALKSQSLLYSTDYILYGIAYGIALALLIICSVPYFASPDKRKSNSFKLSYSLLFGILLFLTTCALTYALCTFAGLNSSNVTLFSSKILLPIMLAINFILTPLVYKMVLLDKKVY